MKELQDVEEVDSKAPASTTIKSEITTSWQRKESLVTGI